MSNRDEAFDYDLIPAGYYDHVHDRKSGMQSFWHQNKFSLVKQSFNFESMKLNLDIGCGPGTFLGQYSSSRRRIGIDLSRNQIQYANFRYKNSALQFKVQPIKDIKFHADTITMIEFIEHIPLRVFETTLNELGKTSQKKHYLIITTPNYRSPWPILEFLVGLSPNGFKYDQQHISKFTKKKLTSVLEKNGYQVKHIYGIQGFACFFAIFSWPLARVMAKAERNFVKFWGFQILCIAQKKY